MDDEFHTMLAEVAECQPIDVLSVDIAARQRGSQIVANVGKMVGAWGTQDEATIQRDAGCGQMRDIVSIHCGQIELSVVLLWLHCGAVAAEPASNSADTFEELAAAHRRGVRDASTLPTATWARQLQVTAAGLCGLLPWGSERTQTSPQARIERATNMLLVLLPLQERLSAYTMLCGVNVVDSARWLVTVPDAAGGPGLGRKT